MCKLSCNHAGSDSFDEWASLLDDYLAEITGALPTGHLDALGQSAGPVACSHADEPRIGPGGACADREDREH